MIRSYFTYKQMVVLAVVELQQERDGFRRGRLFAPKTIYNKIRDFAQVEGVHLGASWNGYAKRAIAELVDANVLRKGQGGHVALSSRGARNLARSRKHFGSFDTLSPFKKSQFLKPITGTSHKTCSSGSTSQLVRESKSQEDIASLRDSLARYQKINKSIALELEDAKKERDDLQLTLLDMQGPSTHVPQFDAVARVSDTFDPPIASTPPQSRPGTIHSDRASSLTPMPTPGQSIPPLTDSLRPTASFTHRPSGSFLNTISNQFTPSPSPGPLEPNVTRGPDAIDNNNDDTESEPFDYGDADMGDAGDYEDQTAVDKLVEPDVAEQVQVDPSAKIVCDDPEHTVECVQTLPTTELLTVANRDHEVLMQKLTSVIEERDSLQCDNADLQMMLEGRNELIECLKNELAAAAKRFDNLQVQKDACERARVIAETDNMRVSDEIGKHTSEVARLTEHIEELSTQLVQSNAQRDDAQAELSSTCTQLETTENQLQTTHGELAATQVQLGGIQRDLCSIWRELQTSKEQHNAAQKDLSSTQAQFNAMCIELDAAKVRVDETSEKFRASVDQLHDSNVQLGAKETHIAQIRAELQGLQNAVLQARELEDRLRGELKDLADNLANSRQAAIQSSTRENILKSQLEDAQERITILEEDLHAVQEAWTRATERKRAAAEADNEVQQMLFRQRAQRREPSFRDSGVSMTL